MSQYKIIRKILGVHESGTKFYELYLFRRNTDGKMFMIRRYAKVAMRTSGGASMIEESSEFGFEKLRNSKHGYTFKMPDYGYMAAMDEVSLNQILQHYRNTSQIDTIRSMLRDGTEGESLSLAEFEAAIRKPAKVVKPIPEVEGWGGW